MELTKELTNDLTKGTNQGTADAKAPPPRAHRQPGQRTEKPADPELVLPANLNPEAWSLFDQHRNSTAKLRASWTPVAKSRAIAQLVTLSPEDQMRVVDYSITGGYPGLYLDRLQSRTTRTADKPKGAIARALEALDAADRAAAAGSDPNWPGSYAGQTPRLCSGRGGNTAGD